MDRAMTSEEYSIDQMTCEKANGFEADTFIVEASKRMALRLNKIRGEEITEDSNFMKSMSYRMSSGNVRS